MSAKSAASDRAFHALQLVALPPRVVERTEYQERLRLLRTLLCWAYKLLVKTGRRMCWHPRKSPACRHSTDALDWGSQLQAGNNSLEAFFTYPHCGDLQDDCSPRSSGVDQVGSCQGVALPFHCWPVGRLQLLMHGRWRQRLSLGQHHRGYHGKWPFIRLQVQPELPRPGHPPPAPVVGVALASAVNFTSNPRPLCPFRPPIAARAFPRGHVATACRCWLDEEAMTWLVSASRFRVLPVVKTLLTAHAVPRTC
jgi:hypothetical protein